MPAGQRRIMKISVAIKNQAKVDTKSKLIDKYAVTDSSVYDSQPLDDLLTKKDKGQVLHANSTYTGEEQIKVTSKYEMNNKVQEKGYRNKTLTDEPKRQNKEKLKTRARVGHVFGFIEQSTNGLTVKSVGVFITKEIIGLINLMDNLFRYEQVVV